MRVGRAWAAESRNSGPVRYAIAVAVVSLAAGLRLALAPLLGSHAPLILFALSVMVAARFGGLGPGFLATGLSAAAGDYLFLEPRFSFVIGSLSDAAYLALFLAVCTGICLINGQLHGALELSSRAVGRYQALSEAVAQLVCTCGPDGDCDYVNVRWTEYTGLEPAALLARGWLESVHPDDRTAISGVCQRAAVDRVDFQLELRIRRHDGVYRWFDLRAVATRDSTGAILRWFVSNTDVHEAHEAREALQLEQERLTRIVATAPGVICSFRLHPDGTSCFPYASRKIQEIYGCEPADIAEDSSFVFALMHPDDVGHVRETIADSARTMAPWRDQFRVRNPSRGEIWVEGYSQPIAQPDGSIEWYGFISDVTERHRIEEQLRIHTARIEGLVRTLDLAHVFIRDRDSRIIYWTQGAADLYGWSREEATGRSSHELLRTEFPAPLAQIEAELFQSGHWEGELRHYRRDGTAVMVASHWALHQDQSNGLSSVVIEVNNDISEQKRVEGELRASEERFELAEIAAGVASWDWDIVANATRCSSGYGPLYGLPPIPLAPTSEAWLSLIHQEDRERIRSELQQALDGLQPYDTEFRVVAKDGTVRWLMGKGQVYRDRAGAPVRMVGVNLDITDRKQTAEQLRALSASLIAAQEEERRRLSRELHDDLTQRLCFMAMDISRIASHPPPAETLAAELQSFRERAVEAAELTRHLAHELHPAVLEDLGIESALRSCCVDFSRREAVEVEFTSEGLPREITRKAAACLYAIAQEALLNISKHARAKHVKMHIGGVGPNVGLSIADDGTGFSTSPGSAAFGLGIVNMRERARWTKGSFSLESQPGQGTRIRVEVPAGDGERPE